MQVQTLEGTCELSNTWDGHKLVNLVIPIFTLGCLSLITAYVSYVHIQMPFQKLFLPISSNHSDSITLSSSYSTNVVSLVKFTDQLFCFH